MKLYSKHPDGKLDYSVDWSDFLGDDDEITSSAWEVEEIEDDEAPVVASQEGISGGVTTVWLDAGTVGFAYLVSNHITTDAGREDTRSFVLRIEQK